VRHPVKGRHALGAHQLRDTPSRRDPNGWLKEIGPDGTPGPNLEASTTYCYLWARK